MKTLFTLPLLTIELGSGCVSVRLPCSTVHLVGCAVSSTWDRNRWLDLLRSGPELFLYATTRYFLSQKKPPKNLKKLAAWCSKNLYRDIVDFADEKVAIRSADNCPRKREADLSFLVADSNPRLRKSLALTLKCHTSLSKSKTREWADLVVGKKLTRSAGRSKDGCESFQLDETDFERLIQLRAYFDRQSSAHEEELQSQKLAAMRQLAYGASHEINNPLANITTRAQTLLVDEADSEKRHKLSVIYEQAMRAHEMISDLMLFAKPPAPEIVVTDLRLLMARIGKEVRPELNANQNSTNATVQPIKLRVVVAPDVDQIKADPGQICVAIKALIRNSIEAIRLADRPGEIVVHLLAKGDDCVGFEVSDNGSGIASQNRVHLFDPFYSGREAGRGLGFGLSKAWRIAEMHGGNLQLTTSSDQGATFLFSLPKEPKRCSRKNPYAA